jgi:hypothetical protein
VLRKTTIDHMIVSAVGHIRTENLSIYQHVLRKPAIDHAILGAVAHIRTENLSIYP